MPKGDKMIYYQDEDIKIRDISEQDAITLFSWSVDEELHKHDPKPMPTNSKELMNECTLYCKRFDEEIICENTSLRKYKYFIITNKEDKLIGFVNFFSINKEKKQGEMGICIGDKRYWNKGIAFRSVKNVIKYIFSEMDIDRIYIETGENNEGALRLFEKLNFIKCGEYLEDDNFKFIVMELKKS
jgi:RimJ/RimL family protein N-acetyltransferase